MKILNDLDYVRIYSEKLKKDNRFFAQQKLLIESQLKSSSTLFKKMFKKNFKLNARKYLKDAGFLGDVRKDNSKTTKIN